MRITFNSKQAEIKAIVRTDEAEVFWNDSQLSNFLTRREKGTHKGRIEQAFVNNEKILTTIIRADFEKYKERFSMRGVTKKLIFHASYMINILADGLAERLRSEFEVLLEAQTLRGINFVSPQQIYLMGLALQPSLKHELSKPAKVMLQAYASTIVFTSMYRGEPSTESELPYYFRTVYAWNFKNDREQFIQFLDGVKKPNPSIDLNELRTSDSSNYRLFSEIVLNDEVDSSLIIRYMDNRFSLDW